MHPRRLCDGHWLHVLSSTAWKIDGAWAFLRMFDRSGPGRRSDDRYELGMSGGVRFQLQARSVRNPFSLRASVDQFRCVPL